MLKNFSNFIFKMKKFSILLVRNHSNHHCVGVSRNLCVFIPLCFYSMGKYAMYRYYQLADSIACMQLKALNDCWRHFETAAILKQKLNKKVFLTFIRRFLFDVPLL